MGFNTIDYNYTERFANADVPADVIVRNIIDNFVAARGNVSKHAFDMHSGIVTKENRRRGLEDVSYYFDPDTMKKVIRSFLKMKVLRGKLVDFLYDATRTNLELVVKYKEDIGLVFANGEEIGNETNKAKFVIRKDDRDAFKLVIVTTYPVA